MATDYTERDAREVKEVVEGVEKSFEKPSTAIKAGNPLAPGSFPANYFAKKDDEKRVRLVQDYSRWLRSEAGGGLKTLYVPTEDDINVLLRKDQEKELLNFETFIQAYFDLSNPIHQKLVRELYPNYFERRLDVIRETLSLQERIAKIKLLGMQTKEDVFFVYGIMNGDIKLPNDVVFKLDEADANAEGAFKRGLFNFKKWTKGGKTPSNPLGKTWGQGMFSATGGGSVASSTARNQLQLNGGWFGQTAGTSYDLFGQNTVAGNAGTYKATP